MNSPSNVLPFVPESPGRNLDHLSPEEEDRPFPINVFPPIIRDYIDALHDTQRLPVSLLCACALGVVSASLGKGLRVRSGPGVHTFGGLYLVISAPSGIGKSRSFAPMAKPFTDIDDERITNHGEIKAPALKGKIKALEMEIKRLEKAKPGGGFGEAETQERLIAIETEIAAYQRQMEPPALMAQDVSVEKLAMMLQSNGETIACFTSEGRKIVDNFKGRYNKAGGTDESIYLAGSNPGARETGCLGIVNQESKNQGTGCNGTGDQASKNQGAIEAKLTGPPPNRSAARVVLPIRSQKWHGEAPGAARTAVAGDASSVQACPIRRIVRRVFAKNFCLRKQTTGLTAREEFLSSPLGSSSRRIRRGAWLRITGNGRVFLPLSHEIQCL